MTTGHVVEIVGGDFFHVFLLRPRVPFFCIPLLSSDDGAHVSCLKRAKKSTPKEQQARARMVACEQEPCKHHAKHARLHGSCAYATGLPRAMLLLCTYPSACSRSLTTYQVGGPSRCAPRVFPGTWGKIFQFCFFYWLALPPEGKRVYNFCFVLGRDFTNYVLLLSLPQREETLNFFVLLPLTQRVETLQFCSIGSAQREETSQFCFIESAQRKENFNILFY
jgi:hypothetical protein